MAGEVPGEGDGPSRPGVGLRRTVIVVISGLLLICTPYVAWFYWGWTHPGRNPPLSGPQPVPDSPAKPTVTISLAVARIDRLRFVEAVDRFAIERGFIDTRGPSGMPFRETPIVSLDYKDGQTRISVHNTSSEPNAFVVEFYEAAGAEAGQRLKAAFEDKVMRAGGFGP